MFKSTLRSSSVSLRKSALLSSLIRVVLVGVSGAALAAGALCLHSHRPVVSDSTPAPLVDDPPPIPAVEQLTVSDASQLPKFEKAALLGSVPAALALNWYHFKDRNYDGHWMCVAAENGDARAQSDCGLRLSRNSTDRQLQYRALFWLKRAQAAGVPNAAARIKDIEANLATLK